MSFRYADLLFCSKVKFYSLNIFHEDITQEKKLSPYNFADFPLKEKGRYY